MPRKSRIRRKKNHRRTIRRKKIRGGVTPNYIPFPFVTDSKVELKKGKQIYVNGFDISDGEGGELIGRIQQLQTKDASRVRELSAPPTGSYTLEDYQQIESNRYITNYLIWIQRNP